MKYSSQKSKRKSSRRPRAEDRAVRASASDTSETESPVARLVQSPVRACSALAVLTVLCLVPFVGKAFHIDDTLFVWAAQHIVEKPLDPYGFRVIWYYTQMPMSEVTKNPPLASYYAALVGSRAGWSEPALHIAFLVPALIVVLGTYFLARDLTDSPFFAALITLVAPGFLVSATSVMSDVPMLALWIVAIFLWRRGLDAGNDWLLASCGVLIATCSLTKYFGACLIPLLLLYSVWKKRSIGTWALYLLIPVAGIVGYQTWTKSLYGRGLFSDAQAYVIQSQTRHPVSLPGALLAGLSFLGGCALPALIGIPWMWPKKGILAVVLGAALGMAACKYAWVQVERPLPEEDQIFLALQLALYLGGGISAIALAVADFWRHRKADSVLLAAWVLGTFIFAVRVNWTLNARSILSAIPAIAILIARRFQANPERRMLPRALVVIVCGIVSVWTTAGDVALANIGRHAAEVIDLKMQNQPGRVFFSGHWGFQYYMQALGAEAIDYVAPRDYKAADLIVEPKNNADVAEIPERFLSSEEVLALPNRSWVTTVSRDRAAGFYSSNWGLMPFTFGQVPEERYLLVRLGANAALASSPRP